MSVQPMTERLPDEQHAGSAAVREPVAAGLAVGAAADRPAAGRGDHARGMDGRRCRGRALRGRFCWCDHSLSRAWRIWSSVWCRTSCGRHRPEWCVAVTGHLRRRPARQPGTRAARARYPPVRSQCGPRRRCPAKLHADKNYDAATCGNDCASAASSTASPARAPSPPRGSANTGGLSGERCPGSPDAGGSTAATNARPNTSSLSPTAPQPSSAVADSPTETASKSGEPTAALDSDPAEPSPQSPTRGCGEGTPQLIGGRRMDYPWTTNSAPTARRAPTITAAHSWSGLRSRVPAHRPVTADIH